MREEEGWGEDRSTERERANDWWATRKEEEEEKEKRRIKRIQTSVLVP